MPPVSIKTYRFFFTLLVATAFMSAFKLSLGTFNLTLSLLVAAGCFGFLLVRKDNSFTIVYTDKVSLCLYLYFLTNLIPSVLFAPNRAASIKASVLILTFIFIYQITRHLVARAGSVDFCIKRTISLNSASVAFGLFSMLLAFVFKGREMIGITYGHLGVSGIENLNSSVPSIRSLSFEPNLFAEITGAILCIYIPLYFFDRQKNIKSITTLVAYILALLFAYTRSVYVATLLAVLILFKVSKKAKLKHILVAVTLLLSGLFILFFVLPAGSGVVVALKARLVNIVDFEDGTGLGRVEAILLGFEGFLKRPLFGNGALSADTEFFNIFKGEYEHMMDSPGWLAGAFIQSMNDSGTLGLLVLLALYYYTISYNYKGYKQAIQKTHKHIFLGFMCGQIIIIVCSQLSSALWFPFYYIFLGMNMELGRQMKAAETRQPVVQL